MTTGTTISVDVVNNTTANVSATMADASSISIGGTITLTGITYNQFLQSLGSDVYNAYTLYLASQNAAQLTNPLTFFILDANGNKNYETLPPTIDPYQFVNAIFYNPEKGLVILNGNSGLTFDVLPNTSLRVQFFTIRQSNQGNGHSINFIELEKRENVPFFLEYHEEL